MERHCVHLYYGDGKGKTTAAIGLAIRACGNGMRVGILSFLKDGNSSENRILDTIPGIERFPCLPAVKFSFQMTSDEQTKAAAYYHALVKRAEARHDLDFFFSMKCLTSVRQDCFRKKPSCTFSISRKTGQKLF